MFSPVTVILFLIKVCSCENPAIMRSDLSKTDNIFFWKKWQRNTT